MQQRKGKKSKKVCKERLLHRKISPINNLMTEKPARTILSYFTLDLSCKALIPLFDPLAKEEAAKGKKETTDKALGKKK